MAFDTVYLAQVEAKIKTIVTEISILEAEDGDGQRVKQQQATLTELEKHYEWVKGQIRKDKNPNRGFTKLQFQNKRSN